jgi:ABC-type transporter Mla MlaB component
MTLRIFVDTNENETTVALHGWLGGEEVAEMEKVVLEQAGPVAMDLTHLTGADADGLVVLRRLREGRARLTGASPFIEMMLARTGAPGAEEPAGPDGKAEE